MVSQNLVKNRSSVTKVARLLTFLFISIVCWALSSPIGSSPDDDYHLSSIWCAKTPINDGCTQKNSSYEIPRQLLLMGCFARNPEADGSCTNLSTNVKDVILFRHLNNIEKGYPEGFYDVMSIFKSDNLMAFVLKVRVLNSLIFIFGLVLLFILIRSYDAWIRVIFVEVLSLIPLGFFIIPSTNPSSWSVSFLTGFWVALYAIGKEKLHPFGKYNLFVVIFFWVGLNISRADGSLFSVVAVISLIIIFFRKRNEKSKKLISLLFGLFILSFVNFFMNNALKSLVLGKYAEADRLNGIPLLRHNLKNIGYFFLGGAGHSGLGWLDTYVSPFVWESMSIVIVLLLLIGVTSMLWQRNHRALIGTLFLFLAYLLIPIVTLQVNDWKVGEWFQPRYILPLVPVVILSAFLETNISLKKVSFILQSIAPITFICFTLSLGANIQRYSSGINTPWSISSYTSYSWSMFGIAPINILVIGSTFFALFLVSITYDHWENFGKIGTTGDTKSLDR